MKGDLTQEKGVGKLFLKYTIPSVMGMVISSLYAVIDGIFVGKGVGETALGAVNIIYPIIMLQISITMLFAIGGANLFSFNRGCNNEKKARDIFSQSIFLLILASLIINVLFLLFSSQISILLGADEKILPYAEVYLKWISLFGIIYMPGLGISIFIRNDGAPNLELVGTLSGAITNIILDYLFIMIFNWGIAGAAIATGIGQVISVIIYMTHFLKKNRILKFQKPKWKVYDIKRILFSGIPSFLMEFSQSTVTFSFNIVMIQKLGVIGVASYSIVMYICSLFNMVLIGVVQGVQPILSYNYGKKNTKNINKVFSLGIFTNIFLTIFFYLCVTMYDRNLAMLFNKNDEELIKMSINMMKYYIIGFFPIGITLMNILYFQITGKNKESIMISFLRCIGFVQLFLIIFFSVPNIIWIYLSLFFGELCNCVISVFYYIKDKFRVEKREKIQEKEVDFKNKKII